MKLVTRMLASIRDAPQSVVLVLILTWTVVNVYDGLRGGFTHDDLMNLAKALSADRSEHLLDAVAPFRASTVFRPAGALLYRLVFDLNGFSPLAFHIVRLALLLALVAIVWRFTLRLTGNAAMSGLIAFFFSFHAYLWPYYASFGFIYDLLSSVFYFSGLYLLLPREHSARGHPIIILTAVPVCAVLSMTSKECGLTFPAAALTLLWVQWGEHSLSSRRASIAAIAGSGVQAASLLYFRVLGTGGLSSVEAYSLRLEAPRAAGNIAGYLSEFFYGWSHPPLGGAAAALIILSALFVARRSKLGGAAVLLTVLSLLPLVFIDFRGLSAVLFSAYWLALAITLAIDLFIGPRFGFLAYSMPLGVVILAAQILTPRLQLPAYTEESQGILTVSNQLAPAGRRLRSGDAAVVVRDDYSANFDWATNYLLIIHSNGAKMVVFRPEDLVRPNDTSNKDPIRLCLSIAGTSVESIWYSGPDRPPASRFFVARAPAAPRSCAQIDSAGRGGGMRPGGDS